MIAGAGTRRQSAVDRDGLLLALESYLRNGPGWVLPATVEVQYEAEARQFGNGEVPVLREGHVLETLEVISSNMSSSFRNSAFGAALTRCM